MPDTNIGILLYSFAQMAFFQGGGGAANLYYYGPRESQSEYADRKRWICCCCHVKVYFYGLIILLQFNYFFGVPHINLIVFFRYQNQTSTSTQPFFTT